MRWLGRKKDPISARARSLEAEITRLEAQIRDLAAPNQPGQARVRSTAFPGGVSPRPAAAPPPRPAAEQVFEKVDHARLQSLPEAANEALYNELGVRKYDLLSAWQRLRSQFHGHDAPNDSFIRLLAAGNIQGLRPLRYEKRVARRRFVVFVFILFLFLWGIIAMFLRH
jgi:hypothetical protein